MMRVTRLGILALTFGCTLVSALICMVVTAYFIAPFGWTVMQVSLALSGSLPVFLGLPVFGYLAFKLKELSDTNERLVRLNQTDHLTGIFNRATFSAAAEAIIEKQAGDCGVLLIIDVDHFKQINDGFGHRAGDETLVAIAASLVEAVEGRNAVVGRLGGEEFGILLPALEVEMAPLISEHVRLAVETMKRPASIGDRIITASIGTAAFRGPAAFSRVFNRADEALYASKRGGRNRVTIAPDAGEPADSTARVGPVLERAS
ncbi:diguanylate cyclase (GGDEF) domain-containing protein [Rhizobium sp. RU20A]|uniref:GGDEF domain-containing protein n=1 Tax=Rhizobium sp. RU20A TaxID=1907412 RepID=UPI000955A4EB|nr:GGDEF domain-containing protein [Rhizobium sp. RU20A]SIQ19787.1 diguanylate cyclase (GGDEF) domain-containing protein [Rhizobium sp. RU20A]